MPAPRRFAVHEASQDRGRGRTVEAHSFEDAALTFLDLWRPEPVAAQEDVALIVTEC